MIKEINDKKGKVTNPNQLIMASLQGTGPQPVDISKEGNQTKIL